MPKAPSRLRWLRVVTLKTLGTWRPPPDTEAQILGGNISHVTGTLSGLYLHTHPKSATSILPICYVPASSITAVVGLNPTDPSLCHSRSLTTDSKGIWFDDKHGLYFSAAATAYVRFIVEVVKVDPVTREHLA